MHTLAIDIGGTKFTLAAFDNDQMVLRESRKTDKEGGRDWMLEQIVSIVSEWQKKIPFTRCGIGFGGPVNFERQTIALSTHVGGWKDFALSDFIEGELSISATMDNDANVGGLGEAYYGAGIGYDPLFYMTLSTGIGGGIILNGHIHHGADSYAGEIGHLTIRPDGPDCLCGAKGCYERMCSGLWLEKDYGLPAEELLSNPDFVSRYVVDLALGLKACIMLINPEKIVIGGGISKAGDKLFVPLRQELRRQITSWSQARINVLPAALGDDSVLYGALALSKALEVA